MTIEIKYLPEDYLVRELHRYGWFHQDIPYLAAWVMSERSWMEGKVGQSSVEESIAENTSHMNTGEALVELVMTERRDPSSITCIYVAPPNWLTEEKFEKLKAKYKQEDGGTA